MPNYMPNDEINKFNLILKKFLLNKLNLTNIRGKKHNPTLVIKKIR